MLGRRLPDLVFPDLHGDAQPGDYWKYTGIDLGDSHPTNLTREVWGYRCPDGNGFGRLFSHTVREHEHGTISIRPGDGSSNSVLHHYRDGEPPWHGYVDHGDWQPC